MRRSELVPCLLFAGLLSLPALAAAQGGPDFKVELDPETCAFSGGSDGAGNVEADAGSGNKMIQVRLADPRDWGIAEVRFEGGAAQRAIGRAHRLEGDERNQRCRDDLEARMVDLPLRFGEAQRCAA